MPEASESRPRQATFAAWVIMIGSGFVVFSAYERISGLTSLETQEAIRDFLNRPPGEGLGLSFEAVRTLLHYGSLVAGACAAATGILGFQVLKRHRNARLALTLLSAPLLVAGLATGGFFPALVVAGTITLWMQPTANWLTGRTQATSGSGTREIPPTTGPPISSPGHDSGGSAAPVVEAPRTAASERARERPGAITAACWVTWVMCGLVSMLMALTVVAVAAAPDAMLEVARETQPEMLEQSGLSGDQIVGYVLVAGTVALLWAGVAVFLAIGVYRGTAWGRLGLLASSAAVGILCMLLMIGNLLLFVPLVASSVAFGLLLRPESRAWCRPGDSDSR